jgi:6-phosphogluconate dehydrogenase
MAGTCHISMVGLGTMGRNLVLNMADHGFAVAGFDKDPAKVEALRTEAQGRPVLAAKTLAEMAAALETPHIVCMLVPAGRAVDGVIRDLLPHLSAGDIIIDGGNSFFKDTDLRAQALVERGLAFLGVGISGGEAGARHGPSIMPGGPLDAYERVRPIFEAVAAKVGGEPCVTYLGPGSAGHYVKMVHNGIEYGLMLLISETYDLMKRGLGLTDDELHAVYDRWNRGPLAGFLIEITARIFLQVDERTGKRLIDVILDAAAQLGTGMWTSQNAMDLGVPTPTIDLAVEMRALSAEKAARMQEATILAAACPDRPVDRQALMGQLESALYVSMIITYAQGMALLAKASRPYGYSLEAVARIWRGGCIIRSALLDDIRRAYRAAPDLPNLLQDPALAQKAVARQADLRAVVHAAVDLGIPVPGLMSALAYYDSYRSSWLPANLIQAQRDYFGAHTYERIDAKGSFHTKWSED